jgi:hypothetical protein
MSQKSALREENANVDVFRLCAGEDGLSFLNCTGALPEPSSRSDRLGFASSQAEWASVLVRAPAISSRKTRPDHYVDFFSARRRSGKAFSLGADDYLLKPMDLDGFLAVAKRVMELVPESK